MSEKPTPAVGQQWVNPLCSPKYNPHTIVELRSVEIDDRPVPGVLMRTANGETHEWPIDGRSATEAMMFWTYAGGPPPSPVSGGAPMEARPTPFGPRPVACLMCGEDLNGCAYVCNRNACLARVGNFEYRPLRDAWDAGARDFPRLPRPSQGAPTPKCMQYAAGYSAFPCGLESGHGGTHVAFNLAGERVRSWDPAPVYKPGPIYLPPLRAMRPEMQTADGRPLSALETIRTKREWEPEPWVESCDPLFWIPDAGE